MAIPPCDAAHVIDIPHAVEQVRLAKEPLPRSEGRRLGILSGGRHQSREPAPIGKGIGVEQGDKLCPAVFHRPVIRCRKPEVASRLDQVHQACQPSISGHQLAGGRKRSICAAVVNEHDPLREYRLLGQMIQAAQQMVAAVEIDDDDRHRQCGTDRHRHTQQKGQRRTRRIILPRARRKCLFHCCTQIVADAPRASWRFHGRGASHQAMLNSIHSLPGRPLSARARLTAQRHRAGGSGSRLPANRRTCR